MKREHKIKILRIILSLILFTIGLISPFDKSYNNFLFALSYLIIGIDIIYKSIKNVFKGKFLDENFLMTIATVGAIILTEYSEAVAVMLFYQIGEFFLDYSIENSKKSISSLMNLRPDYANLITHDIIKKVPPNEVNINNEILIKPGEKIPLDGLVIEGKTSLNTSSITGESIPRDIEEGDSVISGCINLNGLIKIKVTKDYSQSTATKIIELIQNSSKNKSHTENFVTRFAKYYTPIIVTLSILLTVVPVLFLSQPFDLWFERSLIFLVISCPCALVISIPLGFFGGIASGSKNGILIKGGNYLEMLNQTKTMVFDKTGTLTKGNFIVSAIHPEKISEADLLEYAALSELYSNHPISQTLKIKYNKPLEEDRIKSIEEVSGRGVIAQIDDKTLHVGNKKLMEQIGAKWSNCELTGTLVHIAINKEYMGHIIITDELKENSIQTIKSLKDRGIKRIVMLTGDLKEVAKKTARTLNINEVYSELLPNEKLEFVEKQINNSVSKEKLTFIGDGINDAPSLQIADVGISMGRIGSDAAIEAADIVIMDDNPIKIVVAKKIAKKTMAIVKQNIILSILIKVVVLTLGSLGLANMWEAVFADVGVTIIAVINSLRTLLIK